MSAPEWLPDWRDESQYPDSQATATQLAWEFLRRNERYQREFNELRIAGPDSETRPNWHFPDTAPFDMADILNSILDHSSDQDISLAAFCGHWCISGAVDPRTSSSELPASFRFIHGRKQGYSIMPPELSSGVFTDKPHLFSVVVDLSYPLTPKLMDSIYSDLKRQQTGLQNSGVIPKPKTPKQHRKNYARYLRLLDGEANGIKHKELARVIFKDEWDEVRNEEITRKVGQNLQRAKTICDTGYLNLRLE